MFFAQQTRRSPPSGNLSQHISLTDLDCSRDFVRCFPYVFQSNSQGTLDMRFPSIDLQCFKVCYFQMAGENCVETRMRREDHFFWVLWIWNDFDHLKIRMILPQKLRSWSIQDNALQVLGVLHLFSLAMEMFDSCFIHTEITSKCFWYKWGSSFIRFLHLHWPKLCLKSSDSRHFDGISKEEKDF